MEGSNLKSHISSPPPKRSTTSTHTVLNESEQSLTGHGSWDAFKKCGGRRGEGGGGGGSSLV